MKSLLAKVKGGGLQPRTSRVSWAKAFAHVAMHGSCVHVWSLLGSMRARSLLGSIRAWSLLGSMRAWSLLGSMLLQPRLERCCSGRPATQAKPWPANKTDACPCCHACRQGIPGDVILLSFFPSFSPAPANETDTCLCCYACR